MKLSEYLNRHLKTHLVFDFDATVAKLHIDWREWFDQIFAVIRKYEPDYEYADEAMDKLINSMTKKYGEAIHLDFDTVNREHEGKYFTHITPNPEIVSFIQNDKKYHKFLYTSNARQTIEPRLQELRIDHKFEKIITRDEVIYIKPDPDGMNKILDPNIPKKQYLMIGDSEADQGVAENSGVAFYKIERFW